MILDIDAGNSAIKWRIIDDAVTLKSGKLLCNQEDWSPFLDHPFELKRVRVSNVGGLALGESLTKWFKQHIGICPEFAMSCARAGGVVNGYRQPETLGVDRWLAVMASWNIVRGPCLVVDAGSALTVDFVNTQGHHGGGYIVPGLSMMFDALYSGTAGVRFEHDTAYDQLPGTNTAKAVQSGCFSMSIALVKQSLDRLKATEGAGKLVLTGGGSKVLSECFSGSDVLYIPDLVLDGLAFALP